MRDAWVENERGFAFSMTSALVDSLRRNEVERNETR